MLHLQQSAAFGCKDAAVQGPKKLAEANAGMQSLKAAEATVRW